MTRRGPGSQRNIRRGLVITLRHAAPLRVEQHLQLICSSGERNGHNGHAIVGLIRVAGGSGRVRWETGCGHGRNHSAGRWVQQLDDHCLTVKREGRGSVPRIDADSRVRMHAPHDGCLGVDLILEKHLLASVDSAYATRIRGSNGIRISYCRTDGIKNKTRTLQSMH